MRSVWSQRPEAHVSGGISQKPLGIWSHVPTSDFWLLSKLVLIVWPLSSFPKSPEDTRIRPPSNYLSSSAKTAFLILTNSGSLSRIKPLIEPGGRSRIVGISLSHSLSNYILQAVCRYCVTKGLIIWISLWHHRSRKASGSFSIC